jgi:hypothetical protein
LNLEALEDRCLLSASIIEAYGQLPLSFEANQGQTSASVDFLSRGDGYALFLQPTQAVLSLDSSENHTNTVRMRLIGADSSAEAMALDALDGRVNYLLGDDPSQWLTDVPTYGKVAYDDVYSGIGVVYYGNQRQLEYDFVVAPGADPGDIALRFDGIRRLRLDAEGNLILKTRSGTLVEQAPVIYQEIDGVRVEVSGSYVIEGRRQVGFQIGEYDPARPLIIDPVLSYSTYLGGNNTDEGIGIALDVAGNMYMTGTTASTNFPTTRGAFQRRATNANTFDAYVAKLSADGRTLIYATYLGGKNFERAFGIGVDAAGNAAIAGITHSTNFPTKNAFQSASADPSLLGDVFVSVLNANGTALLYSTYLSGSARDEAGGLALDPAGSIYITGETRSTNFPTANAFQPNYGGGSSDAFVAKIDPSKSGAASLVYSTYLDGSGWAVGWAIDVDAQGNAYVAGGTGSADFPTLNGLQPPAPGTINAFVTKLNPAGSALIWSTLLGGSDDDRATGIAVDSQGSAYVTGRTWSTDFPTLNAFQPVGGGGNSDAFVSKLSFDGATLSLAYSTYLGGSGGENYISHEQAGIAVDGLGNAYVTGATSSIDFPTQNPFQASYGGQWDAFVAKVSPDGSELLFSTYLGGSLFDQGMGLTLDSLGNAYVAGETRSDNFPLANPFQSVRKGSTDIFVTKITF